MCVAESSSPEKCHLPLPPLLRALFLLNSEAKQPACSQLLSLSLHLPLMRALLYACRVSRGIRTSSARLEESDLNG